MRRPRVLLIEDDSVDIVLIKNALGSEYDITEAQTVCDALKLLNTDVTFDLCILDVTLPDGEGIEVCRRLRDSNGSHSRLPIIILTGRSDIESKVTCFKLGADDFLSKPFEKLELQARVKSLLRRAAFQDEIKDLKVGALLLDRKTQRAYQLNIDNTKSTNLNLTLTEFRCLEFLATHQEKIYSREELLSAIWGDDVHVSDRNVDSFISKLRRKCGKSNYIKSKYGDGYLFSLKGRM